MWLTSLSIGRKVVMALTGICLVLFVTFHCLMNAVAIVYPSAYNVICEFLGANWYALIASIGLAALFIIHIIYAVWLTLQNRNARGNDRYAVEARPAGVEWSSKNMLVLGIVILAFLVVHLIQFWAKMQLQEIRGAEGVIPPSMGTLFIQEAFAQVYTPIVYIIGFVALWFHMNHGFWSMFQTIGWNNNTWIPRLKKVACWWTSIVIALFIAQAVVFTVNANSGFYKKNPELREQYKNTLGEKVGIPADRFKYDEFSRQIRESKKQLDAIMANPQQQMSMGANPEMLQEQYDIIAPLANLIEYLEDGEAPVEAQEVIELPADSNPE